MIHRFIDSATLAGTPFWVVNQIWNGSTDERSTDFWNVPIGAPVDNAAQITFATPGAFGSGEFYRWPVASPSRSRLLGTYLLEPDSIGDSDLVTMRPDGTDVIVAVAAFGDAANGAPQWVGENAIAYRNMAEIHTVNIDGTGDTTILTLNTVYGFDVSPDGSKIAYVGTIGTDDVMGVVDIDGSNDTVLIPTGVFTAVPVWTLDGTQIVFWLDNGDIEIIDADGSNQTTIVAGGVTGFWYDVGMATDRLWYTDTSTFTNWRLAYFMLDGSGATIVTPNRQLSQAVQRAVCVWDELQGRVFSVANGDTSPSGHDEVFSVLPDGSDFRSHFIALEEPWDNPGENFQVIGFR